MLSSSEADLRNASSTRIYIARQQLEACEYALSGLLMIVRLSAGHCLTAPVLIPVVPSVSGVSCIAPTCAFSACSDSACVERMCVSVTIPPARPLGSSSLTSTSCPQSPTKQTKALIEAQSGHGVHYRNSRMLREWKCSAQH